MPGRTMLDGQLDGRTREGKAEKVEKAAVVEAAPDGSFARATNSEIQKGRVRGAKRGAQAKAAKAAKQRQGGTKKVASASSLRRKHDVTRAQLKGMSPSTPSPQQGKQETQRYDAFTQKNLFADGEDVVAMPREISLAVAPVSENVENKSVSEAKLTAKGTAPPPAA